MKNPALSHLNKGDRRKAALTIAIDDILKDAPVGDRLFACMSEIAFVLMQIDDDEFLANAIANLDTYWTTVKEALTT